MPISSCGSKECSVAQHRFNFDVYIHLGSGSGLIGYKGNFQLCEQVGHSVKKCSTFKFSEVVANYTLASSNKDAIWLLDLVTFHNIIFDLSNLTTHSEYASVNKVIIGNGSGLPISHNGFLTIESPTRCFHLHDILYSYYQIKLISLYHTKKYCTIWILS